MKHGKVKKEWAPNSILNRHYAKYGVGVQKDANALKPDYVSLVDGSGSYTRTIACLLLTRKQALRLGMLILKGSLTESFNRFAKNVIKPKARKKISNVVKQKGEETK